MAGSDDIPRTVTAVAEVIRDAQGNATKASGVIRDIIDQKKAENTIMLTNKKF